MNKLGEYKNGNAKVIIYKDGTQIKTTKDDFFDWEFPNSMDVKITNACNMNCKYCHEGSYKNGAHGNIKELEFFDNLHPYTEVALGGGNILEHPDIDWLLNKLKEKKVIVNITVNQIHFLESYDRIFNWYKNDLVKGIGISLTSYFDIAKTLSKVKNIPTAVIHVINGIFNERDFDAIKDNNLNLLILGYKDLRRGHDNLLNNSEDIRNNKKWLSANLREVIDGFKAVAFDNLALKQLPVKEIAGAMWDAIYQGEDGKERGTMYVDCVSNTFAISSTSPNRFYPIRNTADEMYQLIKESRD